MYIKSRNLKVIMKLLVKSIPKNSFDEIKFIDGNMNEQDSKEWKKSCKLRSRGKVTKWGFFREEKS